MRWHSVYAQIAVVATTFSLSCLSGMVVQELQQRRAGTGYLVFGFGSLYSLRHSRSAEIGAKLVMSMPGKNEETLQSHNQCKLSSLKPCK